jgi:hypothetical protein
VGSRVEAKSRRRFYRFLLSPSAVQIEIAKPPRLVSTGAARFCRTNGGAIRQNRRGQFYDNVDGTVSNNRVQLRRQLECLPLTIHRSVFRKSCANRCSIGGEYRATMHFAPGSFGCRLTGAGDWTQRRELFSSLVFPLNWGGIRAAPVEIRLSYRWRKPACADEGIGYCNRPQGSCGFRRGRR